MTDHAIIVEVTDLGDGTVAVKGWRADAGYVSVTVGRNIRDSGEVYPVLDLAADRAAAKRASIAAHDNATQED